MFAWLSDVRPAEFATILMSILGPLVGVFAAWRLTRQDSFNDAAQKLFAKVFEDMQDYRHKFLRLLAMELKLRAHPGNAPAFPPPYDPEMDVKQMETALNTDCLMLGLLFDKKADKVGVAIQKLIASSEVFRRDKLPPTETAFQELNSRITDISSALRELHSRLRKA